MSCSFDEILNAIELLHRGETATARELLAAQWEALPADAAFDRAIVGHYLADLQPSPELELEWDLRALEAALGTATPDVHRTIGGATVTLTSFLPSLHLNVAADHERLGDRDRARVHAQLAFAHVAALDDSPLAVMTRGAIERLLARLESLQAPA